MKSLFIFLYRFRAFITLVLLESVCAFLIIQNSQYHRALFFNSSNSVIAGILGVSTNAVQFVQLRSINETLSTENARIKNQLERFNTTPDSLKYDSARQFNYINARVINNSVDLRNNLITINIGRVNGVDKDMGVISNGKIVGKTRYVSDHYTVITSLLHTESMIPATIKGKVNVCTVQWDGMDPYFVDLLYVPRHYELREGDTVVTSGYSGIFPVNIEIGAIHSINLSEDAPFYDIKVRLATDFYKIAFVEVAENVNRAEIDSIQSLAE
jgi:rod shape-determining protein MreC